MTTASDLKRVLLESLTMALNESKVNDERVNELCERLDRISNA